MRLYYLCVLIRLLCGRYVVYHLIKACTTTRTVFYITALCGTLQNGCCANCKPQLEDHCYAKWLKAKEKQSQKSNWSKCHNRISWGMENMEYLILARLAIYKMGGQSPMTISYLHDTGQLEKKTDQSAPLIWPTTIESCAEVELIWEEHHDERESKIKKNTTTNTSTANLCTHDTYELEKNKDQTTPFIPSQSPDKDSSKLRLRRTQFQLRSN